MLFKINDDAIYRGDGKRASTVRMSSMQYQLDLEGQRWIFRYDYNRQRPDAHPSNHLHVRGCLSDNCLPKGKLLERIHFPTHRFTLEAIIRLLIEEFQVKAIQPEAIWRQALAESEAAFPEIAHQATSGPSK